MSRIAKKQAPLHVPGHANNVPQAERAAPGVIRVGGAFNAI